MSALFNNDQLQAEDEGLTIEWPATVCAPIGFRCQFTFRMNDILALLKHDDVSIFPFGEDAREDLVTSLVIDPFKCKAKACDRRFIGLRGLIVCFDSFS